MKTRCTLEPMPKSYNISKCFLPWVLALISETKNTEQERGGSKTFPDGEKFRFACLLPRTLCLLSPYTTSLRFSMSREVIFTVISFALVLVSVTLLFVESKVILVCFSLLRILKNDIHEKKNINTDCKNYEGAIKRTFNKIISTLKHYFQTSFLFSQTQ